MAYLGTCMTWSDAALVGCYSARAYLTGCVICRGKLFGFTAVPSPKGDEVEVVEPQLLPTRGPPTSGGDLRATWLGHACQYVEFPSGLRVLFDPVLDTYCAPLPHPWMRRYSAPAVTPDAVGRVLPFVDAVCISHNHYDHLSQPTVCALRDAFPQAHFFVGLGLRQWMIDTAGMSADRVTEMDWWEDADITLTPRTTEKDGAATAPITARFSCLPAQHNSSRTGRDRDTTLWCSWGVASGAGAARRSLWFAGDTGYRAVPRQAASGITTSAPDDHLPSAFPDGQLPPHNPDFVRVGALRGPFDLGLLPIGAYAPRHMFSGVHADPFDAVDMFADTRCKRAVAIHWGAWVLTPEEVLEPPKLLREALKRKGLPETGVFDICKVGETVAV
jgi:N-acyl-phosphatidylethanolamine-hydrolysing phospholipase D